MELRFSGPHSYPIPPPFRLPARVIPRKRHSNLDRVVNIPGAPTRDPAPALAFAFACVVFLFSFFLGRAFPLTSPATRHIPDPFSFAFY